MLDKEIDTTQVTEAPKKHAGGRPTIYKPELIQALREYMDKCPDTVPSLQGFAIDNKIGESTLNAWKARDSKELDQKQYPRFAEFQEMLGELMSFQARTMLNKGASREIDSGIAKLVLAKHGYRSSTDITSGGKEIKPTINIGVDSD